jgi:hypothetical protein
LSGNPYGGREKKGQPTSLWAQRLRAGLRGSGPAPCATTPRRWEALRERCRDLTLGRGDPLRTLARSRRWTAATRDLGLGVHPRLQANQRCVVSPATDQRRSNGAEANRRGDRHVSERRPRTIGTRAIPRDAWCNPRWRDGLGLDTHAGESTNVCGHSYSLQIRSHVSKSGHRSPASKDRYSRTLTPINQAARQTRSPSRSRPRCIIDGNEARDATTGAQDPLGRAQPSAS